MNDKRKRNKANKELMNMSHQSCDEEMSRKYYLFGNYNNKYLKCLNKNESKDNSQISEKQNIKYNNNINYSSKIKSNKDSNKYFHSFNNGYLTTKERSNVENTYSNNNSNLMNKTNINDTPVTTNFS